MSTTDREITTERLINTPRELVFEAWIDPQRVAQWWDRTASPTRSTMRAIFESAKERDQTIKTFHADEGGRQTLGRLAALVEKGETR